MKAAVIGLGPMGRRHVAALSGVTGATLVAVCDGDPGKLAGVEVPEGVRRYATADGLLDVARPDLVIIATTAPSHRSLTEFAVRAGAKAVFCEKPMAQSLVDARAMIEACRGAGTRLAVNHCRRRSSGYRWLAAATKSGEFGVLRSMVVSSQGIGLGCLGTHVLDLMRFLSGQDFVRVTGWVDPAKRRNPRGEQFVDPGGLVVAEGSGGTRFVLQQIEDAAGPMTILLDFTSARMIVDEDGECVDIIWRDPSVIPGPGRPPRYEKRRIAEGVRLGIDVVALTAGMIEDLCTEAGLPGSGEDGYASLEAVVATYVSAGQGNRPVDLPLDSREALQAVIPIT